MSDQRLRELERRWQATGSFADRMTWLAARARAGALSAEVRELWGRLERGELSRERLSLLAYLAVPAAGEVLGDARVELASYLGELGAVRVVLGEPASVEDEAAWAAGLAHWPAASLSPLVVCLTLCAADALEAAEVGPYPEDEYGYDLMSEAAARREACAATRSRLTGELQGRERGAERAGSWAPEPRSGLLQEAADLVLELEATTATARRRELCPRWAWAVTGAAGLGLGQLLSRAASRLLASAPSLAQDGPVTPT